jgi:hypothetical protein
VKSAPPNQEPEQPPLDVKRIVSTLDRHGVQYLLVGGVGATLYGAERVTQDIDLLPDTDSENLARLASALLDLGASSESGASATTRLVPCPSSSTPSHSPRPR